MQQEYIIYSHKNTLQEKNSFLTGPRIVLEWLSARKIN